jgi:5-formyltetrahydrofolate cyclo-ligase
MKMEQEKQRLRNEIRRQRRDLEPAWVRRMSERIMEQVTALPEFQRADVVAGYVAQPKEVQTALLIERCWEWGRRLCVPTFDLEGGAYRMAFLEKGAEMVPGPAGILQPRVVTWVEPEEIQFVAVPALAFDREGIRLGHGGGHYDRMLARVRAFKVGTVFEFQVFEHLPRSSHDQRVDLIVTEANEYRCDGATAAFE